MEYSEALFVQLETVRELGTVNMGDIRAVREAAIKNELGVLSTLLAVLFTKPNFERGREYSDLLGKFGAWSVADALFEPEPGAEGSTLEPGPETNLEMSGEDGSVTEVDPSAVEPASPENIVETAPENDQAPVDVPGKVTEPELGITEAAEDETPVPESGAVGGTVGEGGADVGEDTEKPSE